MDLQDKLLERYEPHRIYPEEIVMTPAQMTELAELIMYLRDGAAYITDTEEYKKQAAKIEELKEMYRNANFIEDRYNCPNCGAPITYTGKCPYCGTIINWTPHCETVVIQHVQAKTKKIAAKCIFPHSRIMKPEDWIIAEDTIARKISEKIGSYLTMERWDDISSFTRTIVGSLEVVEPEEKWYELLKR